MDRHQTNSDVIFFTLEWHYISLWPRLHICVSVWCDLITFEQLSNLLSCFAALTICTTSLSDLGFTMSTSFFTTRPSQFVKFPSDTFCFESCCSLSIWEITWLSSSAMHGKGLWWLQLSRYNNNVVHALLNRAPENYIVIMLWKNEFFSSNHPLIRFWTWMYLLLTTLLTIE